MTTSQPGTHAIDFGIDVCGDFVEANAREWLVTNGVGGYASGTIDGSLTRCYHGLLVAAVDPPGGRTLMLVKLDETCTYLGVSYPLATNAWGSGAIDPHGYLQIERFFLDGTTPVWHYAFAGALVEKSVTMQPGENATVVRYRVLRAVAPLTFSLRAIVDRRDHHGVTRAGDLPHVEERDGAVIVRYPDAAETLTLRCDRGAPVPVAEWFFDFALARERERGLPDREDHVHAATVTFTIDSGQSAHVWGGTADLPAINATGAFGARKRYETLVLRAAPPVLGEVGQLVLAADQFIVDRRSAAVPDGKTVIAGYHWFGDWGRDTAIALPGLAIATGRRDVARSILQTFARFVDRGMLPNVFPDRGDVPEYNTVDAALWYVEAVRAYVAAYGKDPSFETMYAACAAIVEGYRSGTRYRIAMDASDALIFAGEPGVQLTWMDAKVGNWVVTPRIGKPVEINALWYNALGILGDLSRLRGNDGSRYDALGARVRESFSRYVLPAGRGLYDVLDGPEGDDPSLRPNQIFAVALQYMPLDEPVARDVVDVCLRELVTSHGLRTLAPSDPRYAGAYGGSREARDGAYHQGTVWPWLLGPFACAHARIYGDRSAARSFLAPLLESLGAYGLGTLAEIGDGDAPFAWKGTIAQAWSVGETLRAISALEG